MREWEVEEIIKDPKTGRQYARVKTGHRGLIDGEQVELPNGEGQCSYCMEELKESMLAECDPRKWFRLSCDFRLRYCIAKILREKYPDLTRDRVNTDERRKLNTRSSIVYDLADAFLGRQSEETGIAPIETIAELKAKQDSREPGQESQMQARMRAKKLGYAMRDRNDIKNLSYEDKMLLLNAIEDDSASQAYDQPEEKTVTPPPYVGYFVYRLLVPEEERKLSRGVYPIAYWSTSEAWNKSMIEELWNGQVPSLSDQQFKKYLMMSVDDFLSRANAMVSATYGLNEAIRKRLVRARRERGEFIRVLAGDKDDPYIERIKQTLASGKKWDSSKEEENPNKKEGDPKKGRSYTRATTRWGNYGNPPEISKLITQSDEKHPIIGEIKKDPKLHHEFDSLRIDVAPMKPGGRRPNIGKKGQLEHYLHFCFDVAKGTLPMRSIIELVLVKCETLRPVSLGGAENRQPKNGNYTLQDASALEMECSSSNTREEW
jgi:hypothetical protein